MTACWAAPSDWAKAVGADATRSAETVRVNADNVRDKVIRNPPSIRYVPVSPDTKHGFPIWVINRFSIYEKCLEVLCASAQGTAGTSLPSTERCRVVKVRARRWRLALTGG